VWLGVGAAFGIQCLVAVTAGHFATLLPERMLQAVTAVIFLAGAVLLVKTRAGGRRGGEAAGGGVRQEVAR
jgi:putative Ca2+/H+ antiporter (TMEM165/GDT1 family)